MSPSTVGVAREEMEQSNQLSKLDSRVSADGRSRPASQPARPAPAVRVDEVDLEELNTAKRPVTRGNKEALEGRLSG